MKLEWVEHKPHALDIYESWSLMLAGHTTNIPLGTLYLVDSGYVLMQFGRGRGKSALCMDAGLSLDEAKSAAKMLICVGEQP